MDNNRGIWRGKDADSGEWIEGYFAGYYLNDFQELTPHIMRSDNNDLEEVIPETLRECTGLRDKNGRLVFEGDVVEYKGERYVIEYLVKYMRFAPVKPGTVFAVFDYAQSKIIGNIHDDPELLEGKGDGS